MRNSYTSARNIRHRTNIKTRETKNIQDLNRQNQKLNKQAQETEKRLRQLEARRDQVRNALQIEEITLNKRLESELIRLKDQKPELFTITKQDHVNKLTGVLATSVIRWLLE